MKRYNYSIITKKETNVRTYKGWAGGKTSMDSSSQGPFIKESYFAMPQTYELIGVFFLWRCDTLGFYKIKRYWV